MRILLFSMPDGTHPLYPRFCRPPSLGLASLAGSLKNEAEVRIADLILKRDNVPAAVREALERARPDVVGLSCMTFQYYTATRVAQLVRAWNPEVPIVLGGYHATMAGEQVCREAGPFDFLCRGESERTFLELVRALGEGRTRFPEIAGLSWREGSDFVHNPARPLLELARLPLPDRGCRLWSGYHIHGLPFEMAESSRGCTLTCNFCSITRMYGRSFRAYDVERVVADLEACARMGTKGVFFADDNITLVPEHLERLCRALVSSGLNRRLRFSTQASVAGLGRDLSLIARLAQAGFVLIFLGIENMNRRNLLAYRKGDISGMTREVLRELRRNGIATMGGFILGSPDDDEADLLEQFRFMEEHVFDSFLVQILTPYPQVPIAGELEREGLVVNRELSRYSGHFANVRTRHLSSRRLDYLRWKHFPYYRSLRWLTQAVMPRRLPRAVAREAVFRLAEGAVESAQKLVFGEDYAFRKYMERHIAANLFFGEKPELRWSDEEAVGRRS
ncbi:MAG: radical SAM protein [Elusimicrobia bacterium]|nr:radical SAM protein [Elusimicrobiota bacterium]